MHYAHGRAEWVLILPKHRHPGHRDNDAVLHAGDVASYRERATMALIG
jgi:hypothetical protein